MGELWAKVAAAGDEGQLYPTLRDNMHRVILGEVSPLTIAFEDDV